MLSSFDWLRRSRSGTELLATMRVLDQKPELFDHQAGRDPARGLGPPASALDGPCSRCWVYPRPTTRRGKARYCRACHAILREASLLGNASRRAIVVWGRVTQLPQPLRSGRGFADSRVLGATVCEPDHFGLMIYRHDLKPWLQELVLYHGTSLRGLLQVLPTTGRGWGLDMSDVLCRAIHHEGRFALDQLRVRFFSAPHQLLMPHKRDRRGLLTFEISDFISLLEMAAVFRTLLRPEAQEALQELLALDDPREEQFYWGRFLGYLSPEAKDMLHAWRIRQWPKERVQLLYELIEYVSFYQAA